MVAQKVLEALWAKGQDIYEHWRGRQAGEEPAPGTRPVVVVTGASGVGKTVLADHLVGPQPDYVPPPLESADEEERRLGPVELRVVPGHTTRSRLQSLERWFHEQNIVGVLHVVANGYATPRQGAHEAKNGRAGLKLSELRSAQSRSEVIELHQVIEHIKMSVIARGAGPRWMVVAVNKVDLYPHELDDVARRYSPGSDDEFAIELDNVVNQVGAAAFQWESVPVCSWLGPYNYRGHEIASRMSADQRDAHLQDLRSRILQLSGHPGHPAAHSPGGY